LTNDLNTVQWVMTIVVSSDSADWSWCCTWRAFGGAYRFFRGSGPHVTPWIRQCFPTPVKGDDGYCWRSVTCSRRELKCHSAIQYYEN